MLIKEKIPLIFGVPQDGFYATLKVKRTFVAELRPGLEGMTAVAKKLLKHGIQPVVICDNMMAFCMERKLVNVVHIFTQGITKNIALCRTGSLIAALCARAHHVPVVLHRAASGSGHIPSDLLKIGGRKVTSGRIKTYCPEYEEVSLDLVRRLETTDSK